MTQATVTVVARHRAREADPDAAHTVEPGQTLTFGRAPDCTVCLDAEDPAISRVAGALAYDNGTWWLANRSTVRPLAVVDDLGFRSVLPPGRRTAVEAHTKVIVDGSHGSHALAIDVAPAAGAPPAPELVPGADTGVATAIGESVLINSADRAAMVALFAGYLENPPRYDPNPKSYAAAAARLGWPRTTLVKRIEYLRTRLTDAGVPNLMGYNALHNLAEYALTRGLVTKSDLRLLP